MLKDTPEFAASVEEMLRTTLGIPLDEQVDEEPELPEDEEPSEEEEEELSDQEPEDDKETTDEGMHEEL